jgi:hypothetical protein
LVLVVRSPESNGKVEGPEAFYYINSLAAGDQLSGGPIEMSLELLLPSRLGLQREAGKVRLTLYSTPDHETPLLTLVVIPGEPPRELAAFVADLAGTLDTAYQALEDVPASTGGESRALRVGSGPVQAAGSRHAGFRVQIEQIHTVETGDWTP